MDKYTETATLPELDYNWYENTVRKDRTDGMYPGQLKEITRFLFKDGSTAFVEFENGIDDIPNYVIVSAWNPYMQLKVVEHFRTLKSLSKFSFQMDKKNYEISLTKSRKKP